MKNNDEIERDVYVKNKNDEISSHIPEEYRIDYINFINTLMYRMKMRSVERLLDAALEEVETAGGLQI